MVESLTACRDDLHRLLNLRGRVQETDGILVASAEEAVSCGDTERDRVRRELEEAEALAQETTLRLAQEATVRPTCAWVDCDEPAVDASKYCSPDCKNRYARYQYDLRLGRPRALELAARLGLVLDAPTVVTPSPVVLKLAAPPPMKEVVVEAPAPVSAPTEAVTQSWGAYDTMGSADLGRVPLPNLRTYAALHLKIVGASKIRGGKEALVEAILEARRKVARAHVPGTR
jgi:hypothetical protein